MEPSWIKTAALILLTILCYEAAFRRPLRDSLGLPGDTRRRHQKGPARYQQRECPAPAEPVSVACPVQQCPACTACPACPAVAPPTPTSPKPTVAQPSACIDYELDDRDNNAFWPWLKDYEHGPGVHKYEQYIDSYNRHFSKFRKQDKIYMAEVGVQSGGSIELWRNYFGAEKLVYYGFDINPKTKKFERPGVNITIGDQGDPAFWAQIKQVIPKLDIFIDDGGHTMKQQAVTFEEMFWHVRDGGVFLCEDTHTSYWSEFGGNYLQNDTFVEHSKRLIDVLHSWHSRDERLQVNKYSHSIRGMHVYDSMIFLEKGPTQGMISIQKGDEWMPYT